MDKWNEKAKEMITKLSDDYSHADYLSLACIVFANSGPLLPELKKPIMLVIGSLIDAEIYNDKIKDGILPFKKESTGH